MLRSVAVVWIGFFLGALLSLTCIAIAEAEECNPHYTCASEGNTPNLNLFKVKKGMCNAQTCINADMDILDAALPTVTGACDEGQIVSFAGCAPNILTGLATPDLCAAGQYARGITDHGDGTGCTVIHNIACLRIENTSTRIGEAFEFFMDPNGATIEKLGCYCQGTCGTLATITFSDRSGNVISPTSSLTCATGTAATTFVATSDTDRVLAAGEGLRATASGTPDAGDDYLVCASF